MRHIKTALCLLGLLITVFSAGYARADSPETFEYKVHNVKLGRNTVTIVPNTWPNESRYRFTVPSGGSGTYRFSTDTSKALITSDTSLDFTRVSLVKADNFEDTYYQGTEIMYDSKDSSLTYKMTEGQSYYLKIDAGVDYFEDGCTVTFDLNIETTAPMEKIKKGRNNIYMNQYRTRFSFVSDGPGTYNIYTEATTDDNPDLWLYDGLGGKIARGETVDGSQDEYITIDLENQAQYYLEVVRNNGCDDPGEKVPMTVIIEGPKSISKASVTLKPKSVKYDGTRHKPAVTVTYSGKKLKKGRDYKVTYKNNKNAGKGKVIVTGIGRFSGEKVKYFTIKGVKLTSANTKITLKKEKYIYYGKDIKPTPTVTYKGKKLKKKTDYTVSYKNNDYPGKATIFIKGTGKYIGTVKKNFRIIWEVDARGDKK